MGHASLDNLSEVFIRHLYAKGTVTIAQVVQHCLKLGEGLKASEGCYEGEEGKPMIALGLEEVVCFLLKPHAPMPRIQATPIIEPVDMTEEQIERYNEWLEGENGDWDCGDDGCGGEYGTFDSIQWKFAPGWRKRYPNIPILGYVTN